MSIQFINSESDYHTSFLKFVDNLLGLLYSTIYTDNKDYIIVDVGAECGEVCTVFLKYSAQIIAIDAHPKWQELFIHNNNPNVTTYNIGCYSSKTEKIFIDTDTLSGNGFIGIPPRGKEFLKFDVNLVKKHKIQCDTLDNILSENNKVTFIKIDAESCDFEIILGAEKIIQKNRPFMIFEFSGQIFEQAHKHNRDDFFKFFELNNYSLYTTINGKTEDFIFNNWDKFTPELRDILAVPKEFNYIV